MNDFDTDEDNDADYDSEYRDWGRQATNSRSTITNNNTARRARPASQSRGAGGRPRPTSSYTSSSDSGYDDLEDDETYSESEHFDGHTRVDDGSESDDDFGSMWSQEEDSWDTTATLPRRSKAGRTNVDPRPSAWTGNAPGRRSASGRSVRGAKRGGRGAVARYERGPATRRTFGISVPVMNTGAMAQALKRQMGTAREAVGQAGSLAASTTKKLKREVCKAFWGRRDV